ncbi:MAG TPA: tetratricopeptide repeat protein [Planktothrix sp.]|jgi:Flp pilus assembly protein TadD
MWSHIKNHFLGAATAALLLSSSQAPGAIAQAQHWDNVSAHAKAEALHSKALNYLILATNTIKQPGALDQAITTLLDATNADPTDPAPLATLGLALDIKGRYQEALDALKRAYDLSPSNNETVLAIAVTHYLNHDYAKAIDTLNRLLQHDPNIAVAYGYAGFCYMRLGEFDKANDAFHHLISVQPSSQIAYHGMALNSLLAGDTVQARASAEHALSISKYPATMLLLGEIDALEGFNAGAKGLADQYSRATRKGIIQRPMTSIGFAKSHDFHWDPFLADTFTNGYLIQAGSVDLPKQAGRQRSLARQGKQLCT